MYLKYSKRLPAIYKNYRFNSIRTRSTTVGQNTIPYVPGDKLKGFVVQQVEQVPELDLTAIRLRHTATNADYLHIDRQDSNNFFNVAFKTVPEDDTGVAHILEHLVLCGSKQYPVKDPFFKMLNRSLSTFMNAFTAPDSTMYPFSSQDCKDFKNLMSVYLDAAFFPKLKDLDFGQEGWRLEHQNVDDSSSPIIFKGVVFNEMKGVFSDSSQVFAHEIQKELFPDNTYHNMFGGDPLSIPSLSYEQLIEFHQLHYHPSNSRFFTYGSFPLQDHLDKIEDAVLSKFSVINLENDVKDQPSWLTPRRRTVFCRTDPMAPNPEKQHTFGFNYMLANITDISESFTLMILCSLLTDGPNSPFHKSLIESGLGAGYCPSTGYSSYTKQSTFTIGLSGIHKADCQQIEDIIEKTFDDVIRDGFPKERVDALLHSIELATKHQQTNFGLKLAMSLNEIWNHGANPIDSLRINSQLSNFKTLLNDDPNYLKKKVQDYFKFNNHKLILTMAPVENYEEDQKKREAILLEEKLEELTKKKIRRIYDSGLKLKEYQQVKEDLSCLPSLQIGDINPNIISTSITNETADNVPVQLCTQPTNGLLYLRMFANTKKLPGHLQPFLPLFGLVLTKMGAGDMDYRELDQKADLKTAGLNSSLHISEDPFGHLSFKQGILMNSACLDENKNEMFHLWGEVINRVKFDDSSRLQQIIKMCVADMTNEIAHQGHHYTVRQAYSTLSPYGKATELSSGLSQVVQMKSFAEKYEPEDYLKKLREIAIFIFNKKNLRCALNGSSKVMNEGLINIEQMLKDFPEAPLVPLDSTSSKSFIPTPHYTHFVMPFSNNYVGKSFTTKSLSSDHFSKLKLIAKLISSKFLHTEIREKGGAYGSGASVTPGGLFSFYSYRDPNVSQTLEAFENSISWLLNADFTEEDLNEAKLGVLQEIESPVAPGDRGMNLFLNKVTDDLLQFHKTNVLSANKDELIHIGERFLVNPPIVGISLLGPDTDFTQEWKKIKND